MKTTIVGDDAPAPFLSDVVVPPSDPFDLITFSDDHEEVSELPAVPYLLVLKKIFQDEADRRFDQAMVVVDVATIFAGVGEISLALKASPKLLPLVTRLLLGSADIISTATSIYCSGDANDPLCLEWKKYEVYVQLGLLSASSLDLIGSTLRRSDELRSFETHYKNYENIARLKDREFIRYMDRLDHSTDELVQLNGDLSFDYLRVSFADRPELVEAWRTIKASGDDELAKLSIDLDELDLVSKNLAEIDAVGGYKAWKTQARFTFLRKLNSSSGSVNIPWNNLDERNPVWVSSNGNILSTSKSFADETGSSLYDAVFDDGTYVKIDISDGRILLGNTDGTYYAFAILNDEDLRRFKTSVLNVSDEGFNGILSNLIADSATKLKVLSGVSSKAVTIAGKSIRLSANKVNTFLGRFDPDVQNLFAEFGSFKNVGLGENPGGVNILNYPSHYYDRSTWWERYNRPWLNRAIDRRDDIFLVTIPQKADEVVDGSGKLKGTFAQELNHLVTRDYKPINVNDIEWVIIKSWFKKN